MEIKKFWDAVLRQDAAEMRTYFSENAFVNWHCTNEHFTAEQYIFANCAYPGQWSGRVERIEQMGDLTVTVTKVCAKENQTSFHAVSFFKTKGDKIISIDEYWADDGPAPQWRQDMQLGVPISPAAP